MAGAMSKANQRQAQKSKSGKRYGFKRIRMSVIPMACGKCNQTTELASTVAYKTGGNSCPRCGTLLSFDTTKFKPQLVKI